MRASCVGVRMGCRRGEGLHVFTNAWVRVSSGYLNYCIEGYLMHEYLSNGEIPTSAYTFVNSSMLTRW